MAAGPLAGRTIGRYVVLERLGEGGMGVVYKARDARLGRLVALKVIAPDRIGDPDRRGRFAREAQTSSALNHPNIVTIYDIDEEAGLDYIAMEYIEGPTLAALVSSGPLERDRACRLAVQVADGLAAAHAARIVHRDLKPSNIIVTAGDRAKIVDFGLAKLTEPADLPEARLETATAVRTIAGTVPYMSPEQIAGQRIDARSDLFSLGTILYELLAGRPPFGGDTDVAAMTAILRDEPVEIAGAGADVAAVISRCLRKDAAQRFQSALELKAALESCLERPIEIARPSIAVLPFANMSGARDDDYLCEGLAEEIINALTRIPGLRVIARTSAFAVAQAGLDAREAGRRLDVGTILEGSVRRAGSRVRVTTRLVSARDGTDLWSERYDRELTDVLVLEDEIAEAIAVRLRVELGRERRERQPAAIDADAHRAYLEGRYHFARGTPDALVRARACYERAIALDAHSALAYDSLAELYWYLGFFGGVAPREAFSQSTWYALRALELDGTLAETHALLGMLRKELDYNWPEVDRELGRALELNPESPLVRLRHAISGLLPHGDVDRARLEIEAVLAADPLSVFTRWWLGVMTYLARMPERTIEEGRRMIALDANHFLGHWVTGMGFTEMGGAADALEALQKAHELSGGTPFTLGFLAYASGRAGRRDETRRLLDGASRQAGAGYFPPFTLALGYLGLGEIDAAFEWMDRAIEARDPLIMPIKTYPFLDPLRGHPSYGALLRKMKLDARR